MTALVVSLLLLGEPADLIAALRSADAATRLRAVQQVERLGADGSPDEAYLAPLAGLLRDTDLQTRGLAALALWRHVPACKGQVPEGVILPLLLAQADQNPHVSAFCGRALVVLGERAWPEVVGRLEPDRPRVERVAATAGCRRLAAQPELRPVADALLWRLLADSDGEVRESAFLHLRSLRAEYPLPPFRDLVPLTAALRVDDVRIRTLAVHHLTDLEEAGFPLLADLLGDSSMTARTEAAKVLDRLLHRGLEPKPELTPTLLRRVEDPDIPFGASLRTTLGRIAKEQGPPSPEIITRVDRALAMIVENGPFVSPESAFKELLGVTPEAVKVLADRLVAEDPRVQTAAADALRYLCLSSRRPPSTKALANLGEALLSPNLGTAQAAALTLSTTFDPGQKAPVHLLDALRSAVLRDDWLLSLAACHTLAACGAQAEGTLIALLQEKAPRVQLLAAEAVTRMIEVHRIAPAGTKPWLNRLLDSPDARVYVAARWALSAMSSPPTLLPWPVQREEPLPRDRSNPEVRMQALRQIIQATGAGKPDEAYMLALVKLLGEFDTSTRILAAQALARQVAANRENLPDGLVIALAIRVDDSLEPVKSSCRQALETLGKRAVPQMRAAVAASRSRSERLLALQPIQALFSLESFQLPVRDLLWELLTDRDILVRQRAGTALQTLTRGSLSPFDDVQRLAEILRLDDKEFRILAAKEFSLLGEKGLPTLLDLFEGENPFARAEAATLLNFPLSTYLSPQQHCRLLLAVAHRDRAEAQDLRASSQQVMASPFRRARLFAWIESALMAMPAELPDPGEPADPALRLTLTLARVPTPASLLAGLRSKDAAERRSALDQLAHLGTKMSPEAAYVPALARFLCEEEPPAGLQANPLPWLRGDLETTRARAMWTLAHHIRAYRGNLPDPVAIALLLGQRDADLEVVRLCHETLRAQASVPWTVPDLLGHRDHRIREAAAALLVARWTTDRKAANRAVAILGRVLLGPDQETNRTAALAIGFAMAPGVDATSDALLGLRLGIKSDSTELRKACVVALASCGAQAEGSLCDLLEHPSREVRLASVEAILLMIQRTKYVPTWTGPYLRPLLDAPDPELRRAARQAVTAINPGGGPKP
jgi:hypothetical protein